MPLKAKNPATLPSVNTSKVGKIKMKLLMDILLILACLEPFNLIITPLESYKLS